MLTSLVLIQTTKSDSIVLNKTLFCDENAACRDIEISPNNPYYVNSVAQPIESVQCLGSSSCKNIKISSINKIDCIGSGSCINSFFTNISNVTCHGDNSCKSRSIFDNINDLKCIGDDACSDYSIYKDIDNLQCVSTFDNNCNDFIHATTICSQANSDSSYQYGVDCSNIQSNMITSINESSLPTIIASNNDDSSDDNSIKIACYDSNSCSNSTFIDINYILCLSTQSCTNTVFENVNQIECIDKSSCSSIDINKLSKIDGLTCNYDDVNSASCENVNSKTILECDHNEYYNQKILVCELGDICGVICNEDVYYEGDEYDEYTSYEHCEDECAIFCYGDCFCATDHCIQGVGQVKLWLNQNKIETLTCTQTKNKEGKSVCNNVYVFSWNYSIPNKK